MASLCLQKTIGTGYYKIQFIRAPRPPDTGYYEIPFLRAPRPPRSIQISARLWTDRGGLAARVNGMPLFA